MTKTCKTCEHFINGGQNYGPHCGRVVGPVDGNPVRSCETERLAGFPEAEAARMAVGFGACGPHGIYWKQMPEPAKRFGIFRIARGSLLSAL
jgi:hypothetical protein